MNSTYSFESLIWFFLFSLLFEMSNSANVRLVAMGNGIPDFQIKLSLCFVLHITYKNRNFPYSEPCNLF